MSDKHLTWQRLMDEAYARWQDNGDLHDLDYHEFIQQLPMLHQEAVIVGNLNYQVENGGFVQWVGNGYACGLEYLDQFLLKMKQRGAKQAQTIIDMIDTFRECLDEDEDGLLSFIEETEIHTEWVNCEHCEDDEDDEDIENSLNCPHCKGQGGFDEESEEQVCPGSDIAERQDDKYYAIKEEWCQEVEMYFMEQCK